MATDNDALARLREASNNPKFVECIRHGVAEWVTWYKGRLDEISKLNASRKSRDKFDTLRALLAERTELQRISERPGVDKNPEVEERLGEIAEQLKGIKLTDSDHQSASEVDRQISEIEDDPNFALTTGCNLDGFQVDHEELNHETKCVLVALRFFCNVNDSANPSSSKLLVDAPERLMNVLDEIGGIIGPIAVLNQLAPDEERFGNIDAVIDSALHSWETEPEHKTLASPLTDNDRDILLAMLELNATITEPKTGPEIMNAAIHRGDAKRAFKRLKFNGLVHSKQGRTGGYWLTDSGIALAKTL